MLLLNKHPNNSNSIPIEFTKIRSIRIINLIKYTKNLIVIIGTLENFAILRNSIIEIKPKFIKTSIIPKIQLNALDDLYTFFFCSIEVKYYNS